MAAKAQFRLNDKRYEIRDRIRLEPIFKKSESKVPYQHDFISLLNKKHKIDRSLQIGLGDAVKSAKEDKFSNMMKLNICTQLKKKNV